MEWFRRLLGSSCTAGWRWEVRYRTRMAASSDMEGAAPARLPNQQPTTNTNTYTHTCAVGLLSIALRAPFSLFLCDVCSPSLPFLCDVKLHAFPCRGRRHGCHWPIRPRDARRQTRVIPNRDTPAHSLKPQDRRQDGALRRPASPLSPVRHSLAHVCECVPRLTPMRATAGRAIWPVWPICTTLGP